LKQFRMKPIAWVIVIILITGVLGCSTDSPDGHLLSNEQMSPGKDSGLQERIIVEETGKRVEPVETEVRIDPLIEKELLDKKKPLEGLFETTLETAASDEKIQISFSLKNIAGKMQQISYGSGQQYDIWVYNEQNEEIYTWSNNKAFTEALIVRELGETGELTFKENWTLKDNQGKSIPPGKYTIKVEVMIGIESGTISPDELTAKALIEIGSNPS
jgi:hypothetical protein